MDMDRYSLELLMEQRREILKDMGKLTENAGKLLVTFLPLVATLAATYFSSISETYAPILRFAIIEVILMILMMISACLFAANVDRDYMAAIDEYLFEHYDISVMFFAGELSRKHTTGTKEIFPRMTTLIGANAACIVLMLAIWFFRYDMAFYAKHVYLVVFVGFQLLAFGFIIYLNSKRKRMKNSGVTEDCLAYLNRQKEKKRPEGSAV